VDLEGNFLDILVQRQRNQQAAKRCFRKLLKRLTCVRRGIVTAPLKSYGAAKRAILPSSAAVCSSTRRNLCMVGTEDCRQIENTPYQP
jgi:transposase-like protein